MPGQTIERVQGLIENLENHPRYQELLQQKESQTQFEETPKDSKDIPLEAFDNYYQSFFLNTIKNPGKATGSNGKRKKQMVVTNLAALEKKDFMNYLLRPASVNSILS